MRALITGIDGFVGQYLKRTLEDFGWQVFGMTHSDKGKPRENIFSGDILNADLVDEVVTSTSPEAVFHLAGFSSVKKSFDDPIVVQNVNVGGTENLLNAIQRSVPLAKTLIVSSAEVYGGTHDLPIQESEGLLGSSPYALSRIAQELLVKKYPQLAIVIARSFNHTGVGQTDTFVLPGFCKQIVLMEKGRQDPILSVGNLEVIRDFSDVRDVVKAYLLLIEKGKVGEIYNVGSGHGYKLVDLLEYILSQTATHVDVRIDSDKVRPTDTPILIANIAKIRQATNWLPHYSIQQTLGSMLDSFRFQSLI